MSDFFFYGTLCHAPLRVAVLGRDVAVRPARMAGHAAVWARGQSFPILSPDPDRSAEGLLAEGLTRTEAARLDYYEAGYGAVGRPVLPEGAEVPVTAQVYLPQAAHLQPGAPWRLADWQRDLGETATLAAAEFMRGFGTIPAAARHARYPALLVNAAARVRARDAAPASLRLATGPGDVEVVRHEEPYARYFSVEEFDLRFRRFDGGMSEEVRRAVWLSGDASTVLPYDPARDRVALIEQFRAGPHARGDARPWKLEPIAGRTDPGESFEETARREAVEEAGLTLGRLWTAGRYYSSPGATAEYIVSFVGEADLGGGEGAAASGDIGGLAEEAEDIRLHILSFDEAMRLAETGELEVGPLLVTLYWLAANRDRIRAEAAG